MMRLALIALVVAARLGAQQQQRVVFVCEHGTVKSLVALEYFEKLARERGLRVAAASRGTHPDSLVPAVVAAGLRDDGFDVSAFRPRRFTLDDLDGAMLVVALDADVDPLVRGSRPVLHWDALPSVTTNYAAGRAAIAQRVARLVDSLAAARRIRR
jgi:protein-tyrosine-phosphatase